MNIWRDLPKPILILAPMEGVTDTVFRRVIARCGKPSLFFTEFTNVDGLFSKGKEKVEHRLKFYPEEKPLIAQLWGMKPENYKKSAELITNMGFDGIDINMGCPEKNVVKRGACAGLIHNHTLVSEIIDAIREGAPHLPISVKTRIGIAENEIDDWIPFLLSKKLDALTVHLRTVREMTNVPAHWEEAQNIVKLRNKLSPNTLLIGNGDIVSLSDAQKKIKKYGLDGAMIGRGIFHDPFLFDGKKKLDNMNFQERIDLLMLHSELFENEWGKSKHFAILRKYYKIYTHGLPNASEIREELMKTENLNDVRKAIIDL